MGLNRGFMGLQPCPVCHAPKDHLHDCAKHFPYRTGLETQKLITDARALNAKQGEEILKANGIRPVDVSYNNYYFSFRSKKLIQIHFKNAFMTIAWSDPHEILSYDRMHNDSHGIGGKYLFPMVIKYLSGREKLAELDKRYLLSLLLIYDDNLFVFFRFKDMPSWPGLTHFDQVVSVDFTDATKLEHIIKVRN
jgi:hypothetical protein